MSVIVPVLNGAAHVGRCLEALRAQTYPAERLEVIVVDNGSVDETRARVRDHDAILVVERSAASPYVARNAGLARARGEILAFTDADGVPAKDWIELGVAGLQHGAAELVGGQVRFRFARRPSVAELFDAIANLDNERSIAELGAAMAGNLLVAREVFEELGPFAGCRSGDDLELTARASAAGFALVYAPDALLEKPARGWLALARKQHRLGCAECRIWRQRGLPPRQLLARMLRALPAPRPAAIRGALRRRGPAGAEGRWPSVWLGAWVFGLARALGHAQQWLAGAVARG